MPEFDKSELDKLYRDLVMAPAKIIPALMPVAQKVGANMKQTMKKDASGHRRLGALPNFVEYDIDATAASVSVEVGFRKEGQGNLANIAAFGTVDTPAFMDITRSLTDEVPAFMRWVAKVGTEAF